MKHINTLGPISTVTMHDELVGILYQQLAAMRERIRTLETECRAWRELRKATEAAAFNQHDSGNRAAIALARMTAAVAATGPLPEVTQ